MRRIDRDPEPKNPELELLEKSGKIRGHGQKQPSRPPMNQVQAIIGFISGKWEKNPEELTLENRIESPKNRASFPP